MLNFAGQTDATYTLDQSGSGLLKFTSAFTDAPNRRTKTIMLQGSTAGTGEIAGAISPTTLSALTTTHQIRHRHLDALRRQHLHRGDHRDRRCLGAHQRDRPARRHRSHRRHERPDLQRRRDRPGRGDFTRSLAAAGTVTGVTFTGNGGWAAYGADRAVNLGGASAPITWATANTGLNAKTLILGNATATHTVDFQNPLDLGTATRTVQVDNGAAAIDGKLSGSLTRDSGGNLTKTGLGTLALTGTNSYDGATTVNVGTLLVNGTNSGSGLVTVASGATLGGTGSIAGAANFATGSKAVFTVTRDPVTQSQYHAADHRRRDDLLRHRSASEFARQSAVRHLHAGHLQCHPAGKRRVPHPGGGQRILRRWFHRRRGLVGHRQEQAASNVNGLPTNPTQLAITAVNGGASPSANVGFSVVVQAQDANGAARRVLADTYVSLSLSAGSGSLGGTLSGTILAGSTSVTISGVTYNTAQSGVVLTATATSGDSLSAAVSSPFTVRIMPTIFTWANPVSGNWSDATHWTNNMSVVFAPVTTGQPDYTLNFNAGTYTTTNNLSEGFLLNQLNFAGAATITGSNGLALANNGATLPTINQNSAGTVLITTPIILAADTTYGGTGSGQMTLIGAISGVGGLTKNGSGTLVIGHAANTYSGNTTVNAGILSINSAYLADSSTVTIVSGAKIDLNTGSANDTIATLVLGGVTMLPGTYNALTPTYGVYFTSTGTGSLVVPPVGSPYEIWAEGFLPANVSDPAADYDGDGMTNQQEYAFALNPTLGSSVSPITSPLDVLTGIFTYTRPNPDLTALVYTVWTSPDLQTWTKDVTASQTPDSPTAEVQSVSVTLTDTAPAVGGKLFVRVQAAPVPTP